MSVVVLTHERRDEDRIAVGLRAVLTFHEDTVIWTETDAGVADLSRGGMYVLCDRCPRPSQRVALQLSSWRGLCRALGTPSHGGATGGFGVRFHYVSDELLAVLADLRLMSEEGQVRAIGRLGGARIRVC